jgi:hypothetical protein
VFVVETNQTLNFAKHGKIPLTNVLWLYEVMQVVDTYTLSKATVTSKQVVPVSNFVSPSTHVIVVSPR